jgi:hypothetical protein
MNKIVIFLAVLFGLHANYAQSMEPTKRYLNSAASKLNRRFVAGVATGITAGAAAGYAAWLVYNWYTRPTVAQLKDIKRRTRCKLLDFAASYEQNSAIADPNVAGRSYDANGPYSFTMDSNIIATATGKKIHATYLYHFDNTQEIVEISVPK